MGRSANPAPYVQTGYRGGRTREGCQEPGVAQQMQQCQADKQTLGKV